MNIEEILETVTEEEVSSTQEQLKAMQAEDICLVVMNMIAFD